MEFLTERRPVSGPVVYGFLRLVRVSPNRQAALVASLAEYCRVHELRLSGVLTDREVATEASTTAFAGLLDLLALPDVYGVVAPTVSHLGPRAIAAERGRLIRTAGSRLLLLRRPRPTHPALSGGSSGRRGPRTTHVLDAES